MHQLLKGPTCPRLRVEFHVDIGLYEITCLLSVIRRASDMGISTFH